MIMTMFGRDAFTRISSQSCELLIDNFHRKSLPTVLIGGPAEVVGSPMYVVSPVVPLRHLQHSISCPVFINILVGVLFLPGQPRSGQSRLRRSACSCRWTQRSWCSQSQESWRKVKVWAIEILYYMSQVVLHSIWTYTLFRHLENHWLCGYQGRKQAW